jgi:Holliday junction resolvase RusA-like endonuclease
LLGKEARMMFAELTIEGRPYTKKNSQRIVRCGSHHKVLPSLNYENYETLALWQLKKYKGPKFEGKIKLKLRYWMPSRRGWPDLVGLIQATQDILQAAEIIEDDKNVVSLDGSEIVGISENNPRVEIEISEVE